MFEFNDFVLCNICNKLKFLNCVTLGKFVLLNLFNHGQFASFDDVMCNKFKFFENLFSCFTNLSKI